MSGELFTGPFARQMLGQKMGGESKHDNEKWKVLVLLERNKQGLVFRKGSDVLYQVHRQISTHVIELLHRCLIYCMIYTAGLKQSDWKVCSIRC